MWAPDIYEGAPTPVTAYLAMASKAAAFAALIRVYLVTLESQSFAQAGVALLLILAALTMIVGNLMAIPQTNIKRMMAFSSVAQAGYLLVGVMAEMLFNLGLSLGLSAITILSFAFIGFKGIEPSKKQG